MFLVAAKNAGVPVWAFTAIIGVMTILLTVLWFLIRRELQKKDEVIAELSAGYDDIKEQITRLLLGHQNENGDRKAGIMERIDACEQGQAKVLSKFKRVISEDEVQKMINEQTAEIIEKTDACERRVAASESLLKEETAKNREAIAKISESTEQTNRTVAEINGKMQTLIDFMQVERRE